MGPVFLLVALVLVFGAAAVHYRLTVGASSTLDRPATGGGSPPQGLIHETRADPFEPLVRSLSAATVHGVILGLAIGGLGGRAAMRLLFITSSDSVRGLQSDDGFEIGRFDLVATLNLVSLGALIGALGGLIYLAIRRWLPRHRLVRSALCGLGAAMVVGSAIIHADGVDFTALGPLWLAVGLFIMIPGLFGALIPLLVDRTDDPDSWFQRKRLRVAAAPLILLLFPLALIVVIVPLGVTFLGRWMAARNAWLLELWESAQILWAGRVVIGAVGALGTLAVVNDLRALV